MRVHFYYVLSQKCLKDENHTHRHILDWKYLLPSMNCTRWFRSYKLTNNKMFYSCKTLENDPKCTKISRGVLPSGLNKALVHVLAGNYFRQIRYSKLSSILFLWESPNSTAVRVSLFFIYSFKSRNPFSFIVFTYLNSFSCRFTRPSCCEFKSSQIICWKSRNNQ